MAQWIPITISVLALSISLISLWKSYLSPFKLKFCYDSPTFALYKITPDISGGKSTWWIPSIDIGFTFHNIGCRSGEVTDVRILMKVKTRNSEKNYAFYAKWIVDYPTFHQNRTERMKWVEKSVIREWYPLILAGGEQKSLHLVLEGFRWDKKITGDLDLCLEIYSSGSKKWVECSRYVSSITGDMYQSKSSYNWSDNRLSEIRKISDNWFNNI